MKKILSMVLCLAMVLSLSPSAFAAESPTPKTAPGINGTIVFREKGPTDSPTNRSNDIKTEGYTVRDWGNASMGRWMMYKVFGIDEAPTSWTNLDLR